MAHAGDSDSAGWVAPIDDGWAGEHDSGRYSIERWEDVDGVSDLVSG